MIIDWYYNLTTTSSDHPSFRTHQADSLEEDRRAADGDETALQKWSAFWSECTTCQSTYDVVVLAAHGVGGARAPATKGDSRNGRALETDGAGDAAHVNAEEAEQGRDGVVARLRRRGASLAL